MPISLYDTRTRQMLPLPANVGLYVCGPTVQAAPHIGHMRSALVYDVLRRWLEHQGTQVTYVRNITDIDDKILAAAEEKTAGAAEQWWQLAYRVTGLFRAAYEQLAIRPPSYEPLATGHIPEIISTIERLIENGYAYQADDGSANVFFATAKWPQYGELTAQKPEAMAEGDESFGRRHSADFALWKAAKPQEPASASWDSPWGRGRPGWHIECTAMAVKYLGSSFAIHGGGVDLRFPHHENELAQAKASGSEFAQLWMHTGAVNVTGQKMSKSLGNSLLVDEVLQKHAPLSVRYYLLTAHYRAVIDYTPEALAEAAVAFERLQHTLRRAEATLADSAAQTDVAVPPEFAAALNDDLNTAQALAVIHECAREINLILAEFSRCSMPANLLLQLESLVAQLRAMLAVLGLDAVKEENEDTLDAVISLLIDVRQRARQQRDFAAADRIRDRLAVAGIELHDRDGGTSYTKKAGI